ncbi:MAG: methyl-accepting chemotaxis protein [Lachnospiraceae bacterium]|nr:methyl-accepting chemotaxis protein [Lachnospiraceae bacterium]
MKKIKFNGEKKGKSIKTDLVVITSVVVFLVGAVLTSLSIFAIKNSTTQALIKSVKETSELASNKVTMTIDHYKSLSADIQVYNSSFKPTKVDLKKYVETLQSNYGVEGIQVLDKNGASILDGKSYADNNAFVQSKSLGSFLSDPIVSGEDAYFDLAVYSPECSVLIQLPYSTFGDIIAETKMGNTGSTYILNNKGAKVAHSDFSLVLNQQNNLEAVKTEPKVYKTVAALETRMVNGESDFGFYTWKGDAKFGSFNSIKGTNGWSINVTALSSEFMAQVTTSIIQLSVVGIIAILIAVFLMLRIANRIVIPVSEILGAIEEMEKGNLQFDVSIAKENEIGKMSNSINHLGVVFRQMISDISQVLGEIARGNLTVKSNVEYVGDFQEIHDSMEQIVDKFNETVGNIKISAQQVASGSNQVSSGAQALSQGTTQQAASVMDLSLIIKEIADQNKVNAEDARIANELSKESGKDVMAGNEYMKEMMEAMEEITNKSGEISKIIKTIDDIAFQTNILALNAAVEAARAGTAGKGFAVVADEVRNLAQKSAEAAKNTTQLIEDSITAVEKGTKIADNTAKALSSIVEKVVQVNERITKIAEASAEQTNAVNQVTFSVDQISAVVQTNSATSEESAAASEELNGQAEILENLVSYFKINTNYDGGYDESYEDKYDHSHSPVDHSQMSGKY